MPEKLGQLHCGACMANFNRMDDLNKHLEDCPAAINMLPLILKLWSGQDSIVIHFRILSKPYTHTHIS